MTHLQMTRLERSLNGETKVNITHWFVRAYANTNLSWLPQMQAMLSVLLLYLFYVTLFLYEFPDSGLPRLRDWLPSQRFLMDLCLVCVFSPLLSGLMLMGVNAARSQPVRLFDLCSCIPFITPLIALTVIIALTTKILLALYWPLAGYYLLTMLFTPLFLLAKNKSLITSMRLSFVLVNRYLMIFLLIFVTLCASAFIAAVTFGFALLWLGPFICNLVGLLFVHLVDDETKRPLQDMISLMDSETFDA